MGHLSYKAFSSPIFNQCGTPTPHLLFSNNLHLKCEFLPHYHAPPQRKISTPCTAVARCQRDSPPSLTARKVSTQGAVTVVTNHRLWYHLLGDWGAHDTTGHQRNPWAEETSCQENSTPHLTQNLKTLGSWVTSLIKLSPHPYLTNMGLKLYTWISNIKSSGKR